MNPKKRKKIYRRGLLNLVEEEETPTVAEEKPVLKEEVTPAPEPVVTPEVPSEPAPIVEEVPAPAPATTTSTRKKRS